MGERSRASRFRAVGMLASGALAAGLVATTPVAAMAAPHPVPPVAPPVAPEAAPIPPPGQPALPRGVTAAPEAAAIPEVVVGSDDRQVVVHPRNSPHGAVGQMYSSMGGAAVPCTGVLVYKDTIATAAHCLYNKRTRRKATYVTFRPAVMPTMTSGFFECHTSNPDNIRVPQAYIDSPSETEDIGVIKVFCSDGTNDHVNVLDYTGWLGFSAVDRTGEVVQLEGYPTRVRSAEVDNTMYFDAGRILDSQSRLLNYNMSATEGQSGAPVLDRITAPAAPVTGWYVIAIHSGGGRTFTDWRERNWGTRLAGANFRLLYNWCLRPVAPG